MVDGNEGGDFTSRLARLEEGYTSLRSEVHSLADLIRSQGQELHATVTTIQEKLGSHGHTNWGVYFSGLGVLLAFMVTIGGGALAPLYLMASTNSAALTDSTKQLIERIDSKVEGVNAIREKAQNTDAKHIQEQLNLIRDEISEIESSFHRHELSDGHPTAMQRLGSLDDKVQAELAALKASRTESQNDKRHQEMLKAIESR